MDLKQNKTMKSWSEKIIEKMKIKECSVINCRSCIEDNNPVFISMRSTGSSAIGSQREMLMALHGKEQKFSTGSSDGRSKIESACLKKNNYVESKAFPLRLAGEGEYVTIFSLKGGKGFHDRLAGLGLHRGEQVEIIQNNMNGKLLVRHGNTRFFIGGGMAQKIQVIITKK